MNKLYLVIPAYNEEENIEKVVSDWHPIAERVGGESRLVVINDGSRDGTFRKLKKACESYPRLVALDKENQGHGATVLYGYHYALKQNADYVFQTDSDGQTEPGEFWEFWEQREQYDMVIGHRCKREDGSSRVFVTRVLKLVIRLCFHEDVTDANTPFRLMEAHVLKEQIELIPENFNLSNVLLAVLYAKRGLRVKYIPITFHPRQGGENSINLKKIVGIGCQAVRDFWKINRTFREKLER